jgi:hypothetical protein
VRGLGTAKEKPMDFVMDIIYIALVVGFFGATVGLIHFCAQLMGKGAKS